MRKDQYVEYESRQSLLLVEKLFVILSFTLSFYFAEYARRIFPFNSGLKKTLEKPEKNMMGFFI